jgi:hypothetical protein
MGKHQVRGLEASYNIDLDNESEAACQQHGIVVDELLKELVATDFFGTCRQAGKPKRVRMTLAGHTVRVDVQPVLVGYEIRIEF